MSGRTISFYGGRVIVCSGRKDGGAIHDVSIYSKRCFSYRRTGWTEIAGLAMGRVNAFGFVLDEGNAAAAERLYISGGFNPVPGETDSMEAYDGISFT